MRTYFHLRTPKSVNFHRTYQLVPMTKWRLQILSRRFSARWNEVSGHIFPTNDMSRVTQCHNWPDRSPQTGHISTHRRLDTAQQECFLFPAFTFYLHKQCSVDIWYLCHMQCLRTHRLIIIFSINLIIITWSFNIFRIKQILSLKDA